MDSETKSRTRALRLVCIIGVDGTGKTTHAKSLVKILREREVAVHYAWCRGNLKIFLPLLQLFKQLVFGKSAMNPLSGELSESDPLRRRLLSTTLISRLWRTILLFDELVQVLIGVCIPLRLGRVVVSDRYIFDQMVDVAVDLHFTKTQLQEWANNPAYRIFPRPDLTLLLDADEKVTHSRGMRKVDSHSIRDIALRRKIYLWLTHIAPMVIIDASENLELVDRKIRSSVLELLEAHGDRS